MFLSLELFFSTLYVWQVCLCLCKLTSATSDPSPILSTASISSDSCELIVVFPMFLNSSSIS